ncbi:MAG: wax ester/triacylglycerol synthase family O-acyltransferase [Myxococcota bacterium]
MSEAMFGTDAMWWRMDHPTNPMVVNAISYFDRPLDIDELKATLSERLLTYPRFRQRVLPSKGTLARPHWELDLSFDIDAHVLHIGTPGPTRAHLEDLIRQLISAPLDPTKPLWSFTLIEGVGEGNALFTRIHHSLADGFSLLKVLISLADEELVFPPGVAPVAIDDKEREAIDTIQDTLLSSTPDPRRLAKLAKSAGRVPSVATSLLTMPAEPHTRLRGDLGTQKLATWTQPFPLAAIKAIGQRFGGTLNDAILLILTGAMRRYLEHHDGDVGVDDVRIIMPVNLFPLDTRTGDLGNGFGIVYLQLPVGEADLARRAATLEERVAALKRSPEAYLTYGVLKAMGMSPPSAQAQVVRLLERKASAIVTNVPGPQEPVRFMGREMTHLTFWVPQSCDIGLGFSIFSYCGHVRVGITGDRGLMPDPGLWAALFEEEFTALAGESTKRP